MNNTIDILLKCIQLLYREKENNSSADNSHDLVKTIIGLFKETREVLGIEYNTIAELKKVITNIINNPDGYDKDTLLASLETILRDKSSAYKAIEKYLNAEMTPNGNKKSILTLRTFLNDYYKEEEIKNLITRTSYNIIANKLNGKTVREIASDLVIALENHTSKTKLVDPAIVDELDVENTENMSKVLEVAKNQVVGDSKLKAGWVAVNEMVQGGFRRGETVMVDALPHNYKSGFTQSLIVQFGRHNKPIMTDPEKKPLLVYISAEDDAEIFTTFMYKYLYGEQYGVAPDMSAVTSDEIAAYIKDRLGVNGYHYKFLRINPSLWTYKDIINKMLEYEAAGYEIHACVIDYLAKLPTTGTNRNGPIGTDMRDMLDRLRNFFSSHKILFITPHQLSTEAKQLIRNGVPEANFVKEVANKGYTELSKQLDQVLDLELYIHIAKVNKKLCLTIQRGKHRLPSIIDEEKKYCVLPFPYKMPIMPDLDKKPEDVMGNMKQATEDDSDDDIFGMTA